MEKNCVIFHLHDDTSNCNGYADSCTSYKEYIKLAKKCKMRAIAFSNHGGIYDWVKKKQECDKAGVKYIHGVELYMCINLEDDDRGYHIGLYAKNYEGVKELNGLISLATSKGKNTDKSDRHMYYNPRLSMNEIMNTSSNIIITTACLASILWHKRKDNDGVIEKFLTWLSENKDRCFLEVQYHNCEHQKQYNQLLWEWSKTYNIPLIAGTDTHSSTKYKAECRKILQKSKDSFYGEEDEFDLIWKSYDELVDAFKTQNALPEEVYLEAINNTNKFADMTKDFKLDKAFKYPNLYENEEEHFKQIIKEKYSEKVKAHIITKSNRWEYDKNIKNEFRAFKKLGMFSFMAFMSELCDWCWKNDIPIGFGRGSVAGSTIAYILDIIDVDPVKWKTVFSRFCNEDRISLGDIDLDFSPEDRIKVYEYIINRFTSEKTAYIAQFGTLKDRGTIDVLAKGLNYEDLDIVAKIKDDFDRLFEEYSKIIQAEVNLEEIDELESKSIDFDNHKIYCERIRNKTALTKAIRLKEEFEELKASNKDLFYYFDGIKGTIISKGNHPSGIIGSPITLADNLGLFYKDGDEHQPVSSCAMKAVDSLNFVKFDILGLKTVGIIKDAYRYANLKWQKSHEIDWSDEKVWDNMITSNVGVFQFEGDYAFSLLKEFKPRFINDMSLVNAGLRPSGKSYRDKLIAKQFNKNPSNQIDELLKENYGYLVYQEDTIKFLTDICGFNGALADTTRRAIGKKDIDLLNEQLPKILEGYCSKSTKNRDIAEQEAKQFIKIIEDSSEYQFGYNHSTAYSMNGYACVRLRTYYPLQFVTAYLNRAENTEDTINGITLAKELNIEVKPILFGKSRSEYTFDLKENTIYKGIESIKWCNSQIADELYNLAKENQYDKSDEGFIDLLSDIQTKTSVNCRQLKILTILDFFIEFGKNKKLLECIDLFENLAHRKQIKLEQIQELNIDENTLRRYSNKITEKLYKDLDLIGYIKEVVQRIDDKPLCIKEQVKYEIEYLEYTKYINEKAGRNFYIIIDYKTYNDKTKPYVTLRQVKTGKEIKTKIKDGKIFAENPFKLFDILKVIKFKTQKKTRCIGGVWQKTNEDEEILVEYEVY